ncbi:MAG: glycosyltransferase family 4 protein [Planctomycetota bacterium]
MPRRVLVISFHNYRSDPRARRLAEALVGRGDRVDVLCLREQGLPKELHGVRLVPIARRRFTSGLARLALEYVRFTIVATIVACVRHLRYRYDVVHVNTMPDFLVLAGLIPRWLGARVVLDIHDTFPELLAQRLGVGPRHFLVRLLCWIEVTAARLAHAVIAVHEPHRQLLIAHGIPAAKIHVVLNLPDERVFPRGSATGTANGKVTACYHGTIALRLGLDYLLEAAFELEKMGAPVRLRILGTGSYAAELASQIAQAGLRDRIEFEPRFVSVEEVVPRIADCDIGIVPCRQSEVAELMLPTKLLEYVRLGIPCIAAPTRAITHYFDDSMLAFCRPDDPLELARMIADLAADPDGRRTLAREADRFNGRYSWPKHKSDYFRVVDGAPAS